MLKNASTFMLMFVLAIFNKDKKTIKANVSPLDT
jgi:hypothetical protein